MEIIFKALLENFDWIIARWEETELSLRFAYTFWLMLFFMYFYSKIYDRYQSLTFRRVKNITNSSDRVRELRHINAAPLVWFFFGVSLAAYYGAEYSDSRNYVASEGVLVILTLVGFALLLGGLILAILGRASLNGYWAAFIYKYPDSVKKLVTDGIYFRLRHPIYSGQILMAIGTWLWSNEWLFVIFPVGVLIGNVFRALLEEKYLKEDFGKAFDSYKAASVGLFLLL